MHYGDKEQLDENKLVVIVYKHGTNKKDKFDYELSSIQKCQYFPKALLKKILNKSNKTFKKVLKEEKEEEWYEIEIKSTDGYKKFDIISIQNVSDSNNTFHTLH